MQLLFRKIKLSITIIVMLLITENLVSQEWQKVFHKLPYSSPYIARKIDKIIEINGGVLALDKDQSYLFKINIDGSFAWDMTFNGRNPYINATPDGGFIFSYEVGDSIIDTIFTLPEEYIYDSEMKFGKADSDGSVLWEDEYKNALNYATIPKLNTVSNNGNYIFYGEAVNVTTNDYRMFLLKKNQSGNTEWINYLDSFYVQGFCSGYSGDNFTSIESPFFTNDLYISIRDAQGDTIVRSPLNTNSTISNIKQFQNGEYLISDDNSITKINSIGNQLWSKPIESEDFTISSLGYIYVAKTSIDSTLSIPQNARHKAAIEKYNSSGDFIWRKNFYDPNSLYFERRSEAYSIVESSGSIYLSGVVMGFPYKYLVIKTDTTGTNPLPLKEDSIKYGHEYLDVNNIKTIFNANGGFFWDYNKPYYSVPQDSGINSIFSAGLWIGGIDPGNQLHLAAQTYNQSGSDYWPGPLNSNGEISNSEKNNWDKVWKINKSEIEYHIADFDDNNQIDYPQNSVFTWPGRGNSYAQGFNGKSISVNQEAAPFIDLNNNDIYEPNLGEYPDIKGDQMLWYVFNDSYSAHGESRGNPLKSEFQVSAYAYDCPSDSILYNTIFINFKVLNKSGVNYDSVYIGKYIDFDLGCFNNDYVGCDTISNTFFAYNGSLEDTTCSSRGYTNTPIQSVSFLDQNLSAHVFYNNDFSVVGNPEIDTHYYNYLKGRWKDGSPITYDSSGYGGLIPGPFMFPGNPSDPNGLSECTENRTPSDRRSIGVIGPLSLSAGGEINFTMAYTTHFFPFDTCPDFTPFRQNILSVQQKFANNQLQACGDFSFTCDNDSFNLGCVWPGDANDNRIANVDDIFPIGIAYGTSGSTRPNASTNWVGQPMQDWIQNFSAVGNNYKHADCNGDGIIDSFDLEAIIDNYGLQHLKQSQTSINGYPISSTLRPGPFAENTKVFIDIELGSASQQIPDFYALSFSLNYNTNVVKPGSVEVDLSDSWAGTEHVDLLSIYKELPASGKVDIGITRINQLNQSGYKKIATVSMILIDDIAGKQNVLETISPWISRAKAIKNDETEIDLYLSNESLEISSELKIYPNPSNGMLYVEIPQDAKIEEVRLFDSTGRSLFERGVQDKNKVELNTSNYPTGIYFLEVKSQNGIQVHKVSVIR